MGESHPLLAREEIKKANTGDTKKEGIKKAL